MTEEPQQPEGETPEEELQPPADAQDEGATGEGAPGEGAPGEPGESTPSETAPEPGEDVAPDAEAPGPEIEGLEELGQAETAEGAAPAEERPRERKPGKQGGDKEPEVIPGAHLAGTCGRRPLQRDGQAQERHRTRDPEAGRGLVHGQRPPSRRVLPARPPPAHGQPAARGCRLPHARPAREGAQEGRAQEGPQAAAVLEALESHMALFGTDGVRGVAGEFLTAELALKLGRAAALSSAASCPRPGRPCSCAATRSTWRPSSRRRTTRTRTTASSSSARRG